MRLRRSAGLLLHPTSLPGPEGIGTLGDDAERWLSWLHASGFRTWQVMPLGPTGYGDSPYQSFSAFAGNPYLISLSRLVEEGFLPSGAIPEAQAADGHAVDYGTVIPQKIQALTVAADRFDDVATPEDRRDFERFCDTHASWLDDYALFMALKDAHDGRPWRAWPQPLRDRDAAALAAFQDDHARELARHKLWQYWFTAHWRTVKRHAEQCGVQVVGDLPIFVALDSADVWANPSQFDLDDSGAPRHVAGVPPDYFSATGQLWGNPLYRWDVMEAQGFTWWIDRLKRTFDMVDVVRIDHFRGFEAYWEIPAGEPTAENGRWQPGPKQAFFDAVHSALGDAPIVAEDLGVITPEVDALRTENDLPGMRVLQFAFAGNAADPYLPHNYDRNTVVYTGTHDNDTTRGWFEAAPVEEQDAVRRYLGRSGDHVAHDLIRLALASVADTAVVPLQDCLDLGSDARMNTPGSTQGNWSWRFTWDDIPAWLSTFLADMNQQYGRVAPEASRDTVYRQSKLD